MSDEINKDGLEDFFKDTFEELSDTPAPNDWDVPTDQVWENINHVLHPTEKDRRRFIWWWVFGLSLVGISVAGSYFYFQRFANLEQPELIKRVEHKPTHKSIDKTEKANASEGEYDYYVASKFDKNADLQKAEEMIQTAPSNARKTVKGSDAAVAVEATVTSPATSGQRTSALREAPANSNKKTQDQPSKATSSAISKPDSVNQLISISDGPSAISNSTDSAFNESPTIVLTSLPVRWVPLEIPICYDTLSNPASPFIDIKSKEPAPTKGVYAGLQFAPIKSYRDVIAKRNFVIPRNFNEEERGDYSYALGVNAGYQFSKKWSIESGFSYSNTSIHFNSIRQIRYSRINEQQTPQGDFQGNYSIDLGTSSGDINTKFAISRSASTTITENEFINLRLTGKQNTQYGSIPIIGRYHVGTGPVQLGFKVGIVNRFVLKRTFQFESVSTPRDDIRLVIPDRFFRERTLENLSSYQADFLMGTGLRYVIGDRFWFYAEPTFSRSINPVHENRNFKTFPTVWSLDIGMNYRF